jgi:RND family efflux transporter MFP subunit
VNKGQLIAQLDETTYRNQYNAQLAQAKLAAENYRRQEEVYRKGSLAEIKMLEARSNFEQATSAAKATYQNIAHTRLYAPESGYIGEKNLEAGGVANPGQTIVQLLDTRKIPVLVAVPENEVNHFPVGTPAVVRIDAIAGRNYNGLVSEVGVVAVNGSANYNVKVRLTDNDRLLKPGMLSKINFSPSAKTTTVKDSADILVPVQAVQVDEAGNRFVYLLSPGNKALRRQVKTGRLYAKGIAVTNGLKGNERLITSGYQKLADQTPVIISHQ